MNAECGGCLVVTLILFIVIILPISFSYIDYYDYGLKQRKSTGRVNTDKAYLSGRYFHGPDMKFVKYPSVAQIEHLDDVTVFSDGEGDSVGLSFLIDVDFTYFLQEDKIGALHKELSKGYPEVVLSRTNDAIKNAAITVTFMEYFQDRLVVERKFRDAVQTRWNDHPALPMTLDQFHIGRIQIPEAVAEKQLQSRVQVERNDKESFMQLARVEREKTQVEVNSIQLDTEKLLKTSNAEANLLRANAVAEADQIIGEALNTGTDTLLNSLNIVNQKDVIAFTFIRNLQNRKQLNLSVTHLSDSNVVKTALE